MSVNEFFQPPLSLEDYARIHGVAHTVLSGTGASSVDLQKSCIFFALAGAFLLERKHGLRAKPLAGAAFIVVGKRGDARDVISFAKREGDEWYSDETAFHAWVEVDADDGQSWVIDFTAPMYPDAMRRQLPGAVVPSKAFVQAKTNMLGHPRELPDAAPGDYFFQSSPAHSAHMMQRAASSAQLGDLMDVINHWYVPYPEKMQPTLHMASNDGAIRRMILTKPRLAGYWSSTML